MATFLRFMRLMRVGWRPILCERSTGLGHISAIYAINASRLVTNTSRNSMDLGRGGGHVTPCGCLKLHLTPHRCPAAPPCHCPLLPPRRTLAILAEIAFVIAKPWPVL